MIIIDDDGMLVQTSHTKVDAECVVQRMHALIGLLQNQDDNTHFGYDHYLVLEMLREQLPTNEQAKEYLKNKSRLKQE